MIHVDIWDNEAINWVNPTSPGFADSRDRDEAIGLTPNQMSHKAGNLYFQVIRFLSPARFLDIVDPLFKPRVNSRSIDYFHYAVEEGIPFAPLQLWLWFGEYIHWPHPDEGLGFHRRRIRTRIKRGVDITDQEHHLIVRRHEGRHRAWFAREMEETLVPVTVWIQEGDAPE